MIRTKVTGSKLVFEAAVTNKDEMKSRTTSAETHFPPSNISAVITVTAALRGAAVLTAREEEEEGEDVNVD